MLVALLGSGFCLISCGPRTDFRGIWSGKRPGKAPDGVPSYEWASISEVKLYVYDNGRFDLMNMGLPKSGTIVVEGNKATLTVTKIANQDVSRQTDETKATIGPIEVVKQPDGTVIFSDPKSADPSKVVLKQTATSAKDRS
jgi:hypothetical protein